MLRGGGSQRRGEPDQIWGEGYAEALRNSRKNVNRYPWKVEG